MKVINNTVWRTDHLKAILQRCAEQEFDDGARRKRLVITVEYTRGGGCSGYAWYHSNRCVVRIANPRGKVEHPVEVPLDDPRHGCVTSLGGKPISKQVMVRRPLKIDVEKLKLQFASVACHEFAHCRGMTHAQMPAYYKWSGGWREYVAWAVALPLGVKPVRVKTVTVGSKLAHAQQRLKAAETRVKRATTFMKKWRAKVRYYERKAADREVLDAAG